MGYCAFVSKRAPALVVKHYTKSQNTTSFISVAPERISAASWLSEVCMTYNFH
jgi:hypothetical protein